MKKIKLLIIPVLLLLLCGCEESVDKSYTNVEIADDFYIYTDADTCVEYFVSYGHYNMGNVYPRYNADGSLKINNWCLENR